MSQERLRPARFETGGVNPAYGPRLPWKWIAPVLALVVVGGGWYWMNERQKAEDLRAGILLAYEQQIAPTATRVLEFRERIEGWIQGAAKEAPEPWVDPRLKLSGLHNAQGLYLRIEAKDAHEPAQIREAAAAMAPDAIARCLGLAPIALSGLFERSSFLEPSWLDQVRKAEGVMRLRVLEDELRRHIDRDLPLLGTLMRSDYFLLAVQQGDNRRDHPVDVFLWDLRSNQPLLRARAQAKGLLLPVRIAVGDAPRSATPPKIRSGGANDCSIAAQIKELTGEPAMAVGQSAEEVLTTAHDAEAEKASAEGDESGTAGDAVRDDTESPPEEPDGP